MHSAGRCRLADVSAFYSAFGADATDRATQSTRQDPAETTHLNWREIGTLNRSRCLSRMASPLPRHPHQSTAGVGT